MAWLKPAALYRIALMVSIGVPFASAQTTQPPDPPKETTSKEIKEAGFPVHNPLVVAKCGGCHHQDADGNMTRISWVRTTPEGWEEAIKRMVRLNGLRIAPDEAREILRYLSDAHGLAPAEAQPVDYMAQQRTVDEAIPNDDVGHACRACHPFGRPLSWRRSADDWKLLENMHIAFFPNAESTAFQHPPRRGDAPPPAPGTDQRPPVDQAIAYLVKNGPLHSPEWSAWQASMRAPKLAGRWIISGSQPGKGRFFGEMSITADPNGATFSTASTIRFVRDGREIKTAGVSTTYTGYAWRGRSKLLDAAAKSIDTPATVREVMSLSRDQSKMEGRWFWGEYNEFGMDVTLERASDAPLVAGVDQYFLQSGTQGNSIEVFGDHLPQDLAPSDLDFGSGVKVTKILAAKPGSLTVSVDVAADAIPGPRDVAVRNTVVNSAYTVYKHIDFLKVSPQTALAHLGSDAHPKGYFQFEAVAYSFGPDGKPDTADDVKIGPVPVQWKLDEFVASYGDDDTEFVGKLNADTGLFIPASDGPNPKRKSSRNNYGDVWVTASVKQPGDAKPLSARSYLIVAVPQYVHWDEPEVAQ